MKNYLELLAITPIYDGADPDDDGNPIELLY